MQNKLRIYISFLFLLTLFTSSSFAQSTANYTFTDGTNGSFTDMTGSTQLLAGNLDDNASAVTNIGFDFFFMGVRYTQFSVNTNGSLRLGSTAVSGTAYNPLGSAASTVFITAYGADQRTHTTGKVHYRITGSAPNRVLTVEWLNMQSNFASGGTADLTYQLKLYESTGVIEDVYGPMSMSVAGAGDANSNSPDFGLSSSNTATTVGYVTADQSGTPSPFYTAGSPAVGNLYVAGVITVLNSTIDGSRRIFTYTPPVPIAPSALNFTSIGATGMTLNWTDNSSDETGFAIYRSDDGGTTYNFITLTAAGAVSSVQGGLTPSTPYFWKVYAVSEGGSSTALTGSQSTSAAGNVTSVASGNWTDGATWSGGLAPTANDNVTIANGHTVTINSSNCYSLTVQSGGVLQFQSDTARTLTVTSNVTIDNGGTFQSNPAGTITTHVLSLSGNLTNNGTLDFQYKRKYSRC